MKHWTASVAFFDENGQNKNNEFHSWKILKAAPWMNERKFNFEVAIFIIDILHADART